MPPITVFHMKTLTMARVIGKDVLRFPGPTRPSYQGFSGSQLMSILSELSIVLFAKSATSPSPHGLQFPPMSVATPMAAVLVEAAVVRGSITAGRLAHGCSRGPLHCRDCTNLGWMGVAFPTY